MFSRSLIAATTDIGVKGNENVVSWCTQAGESEAMTGAMASYSGLVWTTAFLIP